MKAQLFGSKSKILINNSFINPFVISNYPHLSRIQIKKVIIFMAKQLDEIDN